MIIADWYSTAVSLSTLATLNFSIQHIILEVCKVLACDPSKITGQVISSFLYYASVLIAIHPLCLSVHRYSPVLAAPVGG
jgi:hypothetical protein